MPNAIRGLDTVAIPAGTPLTRTGLDTITRTILSDPGLNLRISDADIAAGAQAAARMNTIIVNGIKATGIANDGEITSVEVYGLSNWIRRTDLARWTAFHGDDETGVETGFHRVQGDGGFTRLFGTGAVDTVADGLYHLGFGASDGMLLNEDGNKNVRVETVAFWLNELLADDLAAGTLANPRATLLPVGTSGTGLDRLVSTITSDPGLVQRVSFDDLSEGAAAADGINRIIVQAIRAGGYANDGKITAAEVMGMADAIKATRYGAFAALHGDDEAGSETGFHRVQNDGALSRLYGENAVDTVADGLYHIGFGYRNGALINEDGDGNVGLETAADWLNALLAEDLADGRLANADVDPLPEGTTGTGLDALVAGVTGDAGLNRRVSVTELAEGAAAADGMNRIYVSIIRAEGYANDGKITASEVMGLNDIVKATRYGAFSALHGDDEDGEETGYHLVQNDGAEGRLFGLNLVDQAADSIYHIGFGYSDGNLVNEDGNRNARVETVAAWMNRLLVEDLRDGSLANAAVNPLPVGTTRTGLDSLVSAITGDAELNRRISIDEIADGATAANRMNAMIIDGIKATGIANDGHFTSADVRLLADHIASRNLSAWTLAHGDDENTSETGFHLVQNDGSIARLYGEAAIDTVADGLYHLGFGYNDWNLINEDGNSNVELQDVAYWLEDLLADDLTTGELFNTGYSPDVQGSTGTGLDLITDMISGDQGLALTQHAADIARAAASADGMNQILLRGIWATGIANDGTFDVVDIRDLDAWVAKYYGAQQRALHGVEDANGGTNFHIANHWSAAAPLYGVDGINHLADNLYHIGFGTMWDAIRDENGNWGTYLSDLSGWMNRLLRVELAGGSLVNGSLNPDLPVGTAVVTGPAQVVVNGDTGYAEIAHRSSLALASGAVTFAFIATDPGDGRTQALFTKDANGDGMGHTAAYITSDGKLYVRMQTPAGSTYLSAGDDFVIEDGRSYQFALSFGADGAHLFIDGVKVDNETGFTTGWEANREAIVVGGSGWGRSTASPTVVWDRFEGRILDFTVHDRALDRGEVAAIAGLEADFAGATAPDLPSRTLADYYAGLPGQDGWTGLEGNEVKTLIQFGTAGHDVLRGSEYGERLVALAGNDSILAYGGNDTLDGGDGHDVMSGAAGVDTLLGGAGNDTLFGGTQNDILTGGTGIDRFVFAATDGFDTITDFNDAGDILNIRAGATRADQITMTDTGAGLRLAWGGTTVLLTGESLATFDTGALVFG